MMTTRSQLTMRLLTQIIRLVRVELSAVRDCKKNGNMSNQNVLLARWLTKNYKSIPNYKIRIIKDRIRNSKMKIQKLNTFAH